MYIDVILYSLIICAINQLKLYKYSSVSKNRHESISNRHFWWNYVIDNLKKIVFRLCKSPCNSKTNKNGGYWLPTNTVRFWNLNFLYTHGG